MVENILLRLDFGQLGAKGAILKTFETHNFWKTPVLAFVIYCSIFKPSACYTLGFWVLPM